MVIEKVLVDGLSTPETLIHAVPEFDAALAKLPAQINFHAAEEGREIHQADVEILHQAARLQYRFNTIAQARSRLVAPRPRFQRAFAIYHDAAHHHHALAERADRLFRLLVFALRRQRLA